MVNAAKILGMPNLNLFKGYGIEIHTSHICS